MGGYENIKVGVFSRDRHGNVSAPIDGYTVFLPKDSIKASGKKTETWVVRIKPELTDGTIMYADQVVPLTNEMVVAVTLPQVDNLAKMMAASSEKESYAKVIYDAFSGTELFADPKKMAALEKSRATLNDKVTILQKEKREKAEECARLKRQLATNDKDVVKLKAEIDKLSKALDDANSRASVALGAVQTDGEKTAELKVELESVRAENGILVAKVDEYERILNEYGATISHLSEELAEAVAAKESALNAAEKTNQSAIAQLKADLDTVSAKLRDAEAQLRAAPPMTAPVTKTKACGMIIPEFSIRREQEARLVSDAFKSEQRYTVHMSGDRSSLRIVPDANGAIVCSGHGISIRNLGSFKPMGKDPYLKTLYDPETGAMEVKL